MGDLADEAVGSGLGCAAVEVVGAEGQAEHARRRSESKRMFPSRPQQGYGR